MPDNVTPARRSQIMSLVGSKNTSPEMVVRRAIHAKGLRFRVHRNDLPGKPDLAFPRQKIAVFVNGCFWHWHGCRRSRMPSNNRLYWEGKINRNVQRDELNKRKLEDMGWTSIDIWECALDEGIASVVGKLTQR